MAYEANEVHDDRDEKGIFIHSPILPLLFYHYLGIRIGFVNSDCQYYRLSNITGSKAYHLLLCWF